MGGGGSSQGMPTSGGMTVFNQLGYDPSQPQGGGMNWLSAIGSGLQSTGKSIASGTSPVPGVDTPQLSGPQDYGSGQSPPANIPQNNLLEALMRLLGGSQQ